MDRGVESEYVSLGRLIAAKRRIGLGTRILREGIKTAREVFGAGGGDGWAVTGERFQAICMISAPTSERRGGAIPRTAR